MEKFKVGFRQEPIFLLILMAVSVLINSICYNPDAQRMLFLKFMLKPNLLLILMYGAYFGLVAVFDGQLSTEGEIYRNRKLLIPVILLMLLPYILGNLLFFTDAMTSFMMQLKRYNVKIDSFYKMILLVPALLVYILQVKIQAIKWSFSWKQLGIILLMGISLISVFLIFGGRLSLLDNKSIMNNVIPVIRTFFYPALYEELLYRVLLIGLLIGLGVNENKANIIQAFFFALAHWPNFRSYGPLMFVVTLGFMLPGFLFGKLYLKTKSLGLITFLHGLHDSIIMFIRL